MRTIKDRGKNMEHGPWIHGSLITDHTGSNDWPRRYSGPNGGAKNVIPRSVGQFTGLKDVNDKEIYNKLKNNGNKHHRQNLKKQ